MKPLQNSNRRGLHRSLGRAARAQRFYGLWSPLPGRAKVFLSPRIVAKILCQHMQSLLDLERATDPSDCVVSAWIGENDNSPNGRWRFWI